MDSHMVFFGSGKKKKQVDYYIFGVVTAISFLHVGENIIISWNYREIFTSGLWRGKILFPRHM